MDKIQFSEVLLKRIKDALLARQERLAVAESVTAGMLQFACAQMENATDVFAGGITAYTIEEKTRLLHVDVNEAEQCDCVSPGITEQMAARITTLFQTGWGIATTGYATIVPESKGKLYAFFSIAYQGQVLITEKVELDPQTAAEEAQFTYTTKALQAFCLTLEKSLLKD